MTQQSTAREVVITKEFDAPREAIWRAWTVPEEFEKWWGPRGYTTPHCEIDLRVGGSLRFCMRSESGDEIWAGGEYLEIDEPARLVFTDYFTDKEGNRAEPSEYGMPGVWPEDCRVEVTLTESGGKTTMHMRHGPLPEGMTSGANEGWSQSFEKLDEGLVQS